MAAQNGLAGAANAAMYAGMNGQVLPSAGHYADMQTLFQNMEQLGGWLAQNREDWRLVQEGLARVERLRGRTSSDAGQTLPNGDAHTGELDEGPTTIELQAALTNAESRVNTLERTCADQMRLQQLYEDTLSEATERIRQFCFEQQQHTIALHQHYNSLLTHSRNETVEAQLKHQAWQAGLQRVSQNLRQAFASREEETLPLRKRIAALKDENRILRARVGWSPPAESEDEDGAGGERKRQEAEEASGPTAKTGDRGRASPVSTARQATANNSGTNNNSNNQNMGNSTAPPTASAPGTNNIAATSNGSLVMERNPKVDLSSRPPI